MTSFERAINKKGRCNTQFQFSRRLSRKLKGPVCFQAGKDSDREHRSYMTSRVLAFFLEMKMHFLWREREREAIKSHKNWPWRPRSEILAFVQTSSPRPYDVERFIFGLWTSLRSIPWEWKVKNLGMGVSLLVVNQDKDIARVGGERGPV